MVVVKDIEMYSVCEHHLLPFLVRLMWVTFQGKIIGLSKIARIVDMYARRLQVQENLTKQIATTIQEVTGALGVGCLLRLTFVYDDARVEKQNSIMKTSCLLGAFRKDEVPAKNF